MLKIILDCLAFQESFSSLASAENEELNDIFGDFYGVECPINHCIMKQISFHLNFELSSHLSLSMKHKAIKWLLRSLITQVLAKVTHKSVAATGLRTLYR